MGDLGHVRDAPLTRAPSPSVPDRARPAGVPASALWIEADNEWQLRLTDEAGLIHGPFRSWRADGSLRTIASLRHGKQVGEAWTFHPDGSLLAVGTFIDGSPHGTHRRYASVHPFAESLQPCCVPPGAWQLKQTYNRGTTTDRGWFNRDGVRLLETGDLYPDRPTTVPPRASFNEHFRAWEMGLVWEEVGYTGTRRRWSTDGVLCLIEDLVRGKRHGLVQSFDETGALGWRARFVEGHLSGSFTARDLPPGHFADPAVRHEVGTFTNDQADGEWQYLDEAGAVLHQRDLGLAVDEEMLAGSPALANERRPAATWRSLAGSLFAERHVAEALLAAARASAEEGVPTFLREVLDKWTMPLGPDVGQGQAHDIVARAALQVVPLLDGIKRGADAAILLCAIAKAPNRSDRAALDFVTAGLLLSPDRTQLLATRALLYGSLGDVESASADALRLGVDSPEQEAFLNLYLRISFPRFDFWPTREHLAPGATDDPLRPERALPEVRAAIQRYATRLARLRQALLARVDTDVAFMIPDLSALLPDGPATLSRWTFSMSAEEYEGREPTRDTAEDVAEEVTEDVVEGDDVVRSVEITVDETHDLAMETATVPDILRRARADWSGLVWLCWATGLDAPGLPDVIQPPPTFSRAAVMTVERAWRCHDKLNTSGLLALTKGIPGFEWEGTSIDLIPAALASVALDEYIEARAVFAWLCDPENRSPWQEDLRGAE